jgi:hypothetical protein
MESLEKASSGNIIVMGASDYNELVFKNPRNYDVVLLWNVPSGYVNCKHCDEVA